jgi:hypothetical protein
MATAACFAFQREASLTVFWDFFDSIGQTRKSRAHAKYVAKTLQLLGHRRFLTSRTSEPRGSRSFFAVRRLTDQTMTLSQFVHLRAPPHE